MKSDLTSIIGIACLLPEADNSSEYWKNLKVNRNCIKAIPSNRLDTNQFQHQLDSNICTKGGFIADIASFDRLFFGISPNEAKQMDPQQRLALQESWHCIEDANIDISKLQQNKTGVFAAQMSEDYLQLSIDRSVPIDQFTCIGNYASSLANRISHHFKLSGPSISINAACAGSLVAIHQARQSLRLGECDYALVIAANIICHPLRHLSFSMAGMLSRTGQCHTFAANADGYVPGEGVFAVLLCNSKIAEQNHHRVYGNILNSGINHNAGTNSISSPSIDKQAALLQSMYQDIDIDRLDYIELHGTGTSLGDPIEYQALGKALGGKLKKTCLLGSVKTSIGHLEASAGLAGLIKVVLMLQHELITPSFDSQNPNPLINLQDTLFQLSTTQHAWPANHTTPRIAGISSMGFGGVNAHLVISDHNKDKNTTMKAATSPLIPLLISVKTEANINATKDLWLSFLESNSAEASQICLASIHNRTSLDYRFAFLATNPSKEQLASSLSEGNFTKKQELPYLVLDSLDFELPKIYQDNSSSVAKAKIHAIEQSSVDLSAKQKANMITQIILFDLLTQANIKCRTIICAETAANGVLFYLDCISLEAAASHLNSSMELPIRFEQLKLPLILGNSLIVTDSYLKDLFTIAEPNRMELGEFLSKAFILSEHQYTFKGLLARWQHQLKKYNIDLFEHWQSLIEAINDSQKYFTVSKTQFVVLLAIIVSLEKLRKIWVLTYCIHDEILDKKLQDLAYLLSNNILDEDDVVQGVLGDDLECKGLIAKIYLKLTDLDGLPFLRSQSHSIPYRKVLENTNFFDKYAQENVIYIGNNNKDIPLTHWSVISAGGLEEKINRTLVNQWLHGQNINWSFVFPDKQPSTVNLPKYLFNLKEAFWH